MADFRENYVHEFDEAQKNEFLKEQNEINEEKKHIDQKIEEIEKFLMKNTEKINALAVEEKIFYEQIMKKTEILNELTKIFQNKSLAEIEEECLKLKNVIKELKENKEKNLIFHNNQAFALMHSKKQTEEELKILNEKINEIEKIQTEKLESEILDLNKKCLAFDEKIKNSVLIKEILDKKISCIKDYYLHTNEADEFKSKILENNKNFEELKEMVLALTKIVPDLINFKIAEYEDYIKSLVWSFDSEIFSITSVISSNYVELTEEKNGSQETHFLIDKLKQTIHAKNNELLVVLLSGYFKRIYELISRIKGLNVDFTYSDIENTEKMIKELDFNDEAKSLKELEENLSTVCASITENHNSKTQCIQKTHEYKELINKKNSEYDQLKKKQIQLIEKMTEIEAKIKNNTEKLLEIQKKISEKLEFFSKEKKLLKEKILAAESLNSKVAEIQKTEDLYSKIKENMILVQENAKNNENTKSELESQRKFKIDILEKIESELSKIEKYQSNYNNYKLYIEYQNKQKTLTSEISNLSTRLQDFERLENLETTSEDLLSKKVEQGKTDQQILLITKELKDLEKMPSNSEDHAINLFIETELLEKAISEQSVLMKSLGSSIIKYHQQKIFQINSLISKLWSETYKGNDIETILICADVDNSSKKTSFNYRICFKSKNCEVDMRGRCSSGQKMMASLVIRIALAQAFSAGFTVVALDEPTTNMDNLNSEGLAESISFLSSKYEKLQFVIISHDQEFLRKIIRHSPRESYFTIEKNKNLSFISKIKIE